MTRSRPTPQSNLRRVLNPATGRALVHPWRDRLTALRAGTDPDEAPPHAPAATGLPQPMTRVSARKHYRMRTKGTNVRRTAKASRDRALPGKDRIRARKEARRTTAAIGAFAAATAA